MRLHRILGPAIAIAVLGTLASAPVTAGSERPSHRSVADRPGRATPSSVASTTTTTTTTTAVLESSAPAPVAVAPAAPPAPVCPIAGPTSFANTWAIPRPGGLTHNGVDMFAEHGTPVVAPVSGLVEHFWDRLGGQAFRLWADDGTYFYGAHLSDAGHGGPVAAGTIVGHVGTSGNAAGTSPHLHLEIHPGRTPGQSPNPMNPTPTVASWCAVNRHGLLPY